MPQTSTQITDNLVEIINYTSPESDAKQTKQDLINRENCEVKNIPQAELAEKYENWNWIKHNPEDLELYAKYLANSQSLEIYYNHEKALEEFGDRFWFDKGLVFPKDKIQDQKSDYQLIKLGKKFEVEYLPSWISKTDIKIPKGSQGFEVFEQEYKIVWSYMNPTYFHISTKPTMISFNQVIIGTQNKTELFYLLALLNSKLSWKILKLQLSNEHEQALILGIKAIKDYIRIPILNTPQKLKQKQKLIQLAQELLDAENVALEQLVDFDDDRVLPQKWDWWAVHHGQVFLTVDNHDYWFEIKSKLNENRIYDALEAKYGDPVKKIEEGISFNDFKKTTIFDKNHQTKIKNQIDELVLEVYQLPAQN